jgi:RNA polymerase sigma-70 factor (ECF subfamily)
MGVVVLPDVSDPDALLIQASWDDPDRFAALYDRYAAQLFRYAYRRIGAAAADDVVAEAFLAAFRRRHSYDLSRPDARPWLFGILTRELGRHERAERAHYRALARSAGSSTPTDSAADAADAVVDRVSAGAARNQLAAALAALPARDRDVLLLVAWGDFTYEDVASALDIPVGTVRSRLNRARRKVRAALGPTSDERTSPDGH